MTNDPAKHSIDPMHSNHDNDPQNMKTAKANNFNFTFFFACFILNKNGQKCQFKSGKLKMRIK